MPREPYLIENNQDAVKDYASPRNDGFNKDPDSDNYLKKIELDDQILVERKPLIRTTLVVYITAQWTQGTEVELRVPVDVEYVAGYENEVFDRVYEQALKNVAGHGEGFERITEFEVTEIDFQPRESEVTFEEKPVIEREFREDEVIERERPPTITETIGRVATRTVKGIASGIVSGVKTVGKFIGSAIGKLFGR